MKKLLTVMLALCLLCGVAMAETVTELNWNDTFGPAIEAGEVAGNFVTIEQVGLKIWLPEGLEAVELDEESIAAGYIAYFTEESDGATVAVQYVNMDGMSLEDYAETIKGIEGVAEVEMIIVNGLPAVNYDMPASDSTTNAFATEAGYILEITMYPISAEGAEYVWGAVGASIQAAE